LKKTYQDAGGSTERLVAKPVASSVVLQVAGVPVDEGDFTLDETTGILTFKPAATPANSAVIRAGFRFDVPVRFDTDRIEIDLDAFKAGRIPSIPLIEIAP